ncbi:hypothetical protein FOZ63_026104, partial [Perkinsus olseni]
QTSIRAYTKRFRWKSQVFGPMYTGDSVAEWSNLQAVIPMITALAATGGFSFTGSDIGGFTGNPDAELYTRWFQLSAATSAFFRLHSDIHSPPRDPWFYDETTLKRLKNATLDRYRLLPYWYHAFARYVYYGKPVIRPLWHAHIDDPNTYKCNSPGCDSVIDQQVLVGTDIMVRGVIEEGAKSVKVYFPRGTQWYSTTGELMSSGWQDVKVTMDDIPRYFRAGSIIPRKDTYRSSGQLMYNDNYTLYVYIDPESSSAEGYAYLDDTISYNSTDEDKHNFWKLTDHLEEPAVRLAFVVAIETGLAYQRRLEVLITYGKRPVPASPLGRSSSGTFNATVKLSALGEEGPDVFLLQLRFYEDGTVRFTMDENHAIVGDIRTRYVIPSGDIIQDENLPLAKDLEYTYSQEEKSSTFQIGESVVVKLMHAGVVLTVAVDGQVVQTINSKKHLVIEGTRY